MKKASELSSIRDIFRHPMFRAAKSAIVQKLRPDDHNLEALRRGYTEHWPSVNEQFDLVVLSLGEERAQKRQIVVGVLSEIEPSPKDKKLFRIRADQFIEVGIHDLSNVGDARFYATKRGGGGSRVKVYRDGAVPVPLKDGVPPGMMERRLIWVRKNHQKFADPVRRHWESRCAVYDDDCNGLLVASHIYPWHMSNAQQKTDHSNGLLLSAPLDRLFDQRHITFDDDGRLILGSHLGRGTLSAFGLARSRPLFLRREKLTAAAKKYLKLHRGLFAMRGSA